VTSTLAVRPIVELARGATAGEGDGRPLRLAGRSDLTFAAAEIMARDATGSRRRVVSTAALKTEPDPRLAVLLAELERPRAAIAGIAGAVVAVPITVALVRAGPYLRGRPPGPPAASADQPEQPSQQR